MYHIADRAGREFGSGGALNGIHAGTFIREDSPLASVKINGLPLKVFDHLGAINDGGVVHDQIAPLEMVAEMMDITEREE